MADITVLGDFHLPSDSPNCTQLNRFQIENQKQVLRYAGHNQSVTSRLETSRYRDFSQFFESIGLDLENFGLEKKSRYQSRKYLVSKKSLGIGLKNI